MTPLVCPRCRQRYSRQPRLDPECLEAISLRCLPCGASQSYAPTKAGYKRTGPYAMACGCDSTGKRCETEEVLAAGIEAGHRGEINLTAARTAYHAHFA